MSHRDPSTVERPLADLVDPEVPVSWDAVKALVRSRLTKGKRMRRWHSARELEDAVERRSLRLIDMTGLKVIGLKSTAELRATLEARAKRMKEAMEEDPVVLNGPS